MKRDREDAPFLHQQPFRAVPAARFLRCTVSSPHIAAAKLDANLGCSVGLFGRIKRKPEAVEQAALHITHHIQSATDPLDYLSNGASLGSSER